MLQFFNIRSKYTLLAFAAFQYTFKVRFISLITGRVHLDLDAAYSDTSVGQNCVTEGKRTVFFRKEFWMYKIAGELLIRVGAG